MASVAFQTTERQYAWRSESIVPGSERSLTLLAHGGSEQGFLFFDRVFRIDPEAERTNATFDFDIDPAGNGGVIFQNEGPYSPNTQRIWLKFGGYLNRPVPVWGVEHLNGSLIGEHDYNVPFLGNGGTFEFTFDRNATSVNVRFPNDVHVELGFGGRSILTPETRAMRIGIWNRAARASLTRLSVDQLLPS